MRNRTLMTALFGAISGAVTMLIWDARGGRRRTPRLAANTVGACRSATAAAKAHSRDVVHRARGALSDLKASTEPDGEASDEVLRERVRSRLGHVVSHAHLLEVTVDDGVATISGPIAEGASAPVIEELSRVPGLERIDGILSEEPTTESTPSLKPHRRRAWFRTGAARQFDNS